MKYHLAELNVGRLVAPTDDPRVKEFMDHLIKGRQDVHHCDGDRCAPECGLV